MVTCRMRNSQVLLRELGDIDIGVGTLQATNSRMALAVEGCVQSCALVGQATTPGACGRIALAGTGAERMAVGKCRAKVLPVSRR